MYRFFEQLSSRIAAPFISESSRNSKVWHCRCGQSLFFRNSQCLACSAALGYQPEQSRTTLLRLIAQRRRTGQALTVAKEQRLSAAAMQDLAVARTLADERRGDAGTELFEETVHGELSLRGAKTRSFRLADRSHNCGEGACLWRGSLLPFDCAAGANAKGTASRSNGGKPPRHRSALDRDIVFLQEYHKRLFIQHLQR